MGSSTTRCAGVRRSWLTALLFAGVAAIASGNAGAQSEGQGQSEGQSEGSASTAPAALPEDRGGIDPFADLLIARMAEYLAAAQRFHVTAEVIREQLLDSGHKIQMSRSVAIRVRRPDRLRADVVTDQRELRFLYDGTSLGMQDLNRNEYAILDDVPGNIDDMIDDVKRRLDIAMPLVDLLVSDVYENYERNATTATYVGLHRLAGVRHHHLLLSNENVDYQLWIRDGADPLPARIVITHPQSPGVPQETVMITGWNFTPQVPDVVFQFNPPADADELDMLVPSARIEEGAGS